MKIPNSRPRFQREFFAWYRQNAHRFALPLRLMACRKHSIELGLMDITPVISISLSRTNLGVHVVLGGEHFDTLLDLDIAPRHHPFGFVCEFCDDKTRQIFKTRADLWRDHIYEELLTWVNTGLAPANWLRLSHIGTNGTSWASLIRSPDELSRADPNETLLRNLVRIDGEPCFTQHDTVQHRLIPLRLGHHPTQDIPEDAPTRMAE